MMTDQKQLLKQVFDFQKTTVVSSFNMMQMMQTRSEKMMDMFMNQSCWFSEKWKDVFSPWKKAYEEGWQSFRQSVNDNLEKMESYVNKD